MDLPQETGGAAAGGPAAQQQEAAAGGEGSAPEIGQASGRSGEAARQACSAAHRARASSSPVWTRVRWWIDTAGLLVSGRSRSWHLSWTVKKSRRTTSEQELALLEEDL